MPGLFLSHLQSLNTREFLIFCFFFFNSLGLLWGVIKVFNPDGLIVTGLNLTEREADGAYTPLLFLRYLLPQLEASDVVQNRCCKLHCSSPDDFVAHGVVQSVVQSPRALASLYAPG